MNGFKAHMMMSVRFVHLDKLTRHCFNISRTGVGLKVLVGS